MKKLSFSTYIAAACLLISSFFPTTVGAQVVTQNTTHQSIIKINTYASGLDASVSFSPDGKTSGVDIGAGIDPSTPLYLNGGINGNTVIVDRSLQQDFQNIREAVTDAAQATMRAVKEEGQRIMNLLKVKKNAKPNS